MDLHQDRTPQQPSSNTEETPAAFNRDAYVAEKREHVDRIIDGHLGKLAVDLDAGKSETLLEYLRTMGRFHRYSFSNQILIFIQAPQATHIAGFQAWRRDFGRYVKKGEKGIVVLAPVTKVIGTKEELRGEGRTEKVPVRKIVNTKPVHVFDVSQTDGKPLPAFASVRGDVGGCLARLESLYKVQGVELRYVSAIQGGALGVSRGKSVDIVDNLSGAAKLQTAVHELAHELLHRDPERREKTTRLIRETEAEAVAYVVCSAVGLECSTASSDYLHLYGGSRAVLEKSLEAIRDTAKIILDAVVPKEPDQGGGSE